MHAALGDEHALHRIHVGDDGVDRERLVRGEPGVHRLEAEDLLESLVVEERGDLLVELAEAAHLENRQAVAPRLEEVERGVEVGVDVRPHLGGVQTFEPVREATEGVGFLLVREASNLFGHRFAPVLHHQGGAVCVAGPVHRVDRLDRHVIGHGGPGGDEGLLEEVGHGQHRRPVVEAETVRSDHAGAAAGDGLTLDDGDLVLALRQVCCSRESAEPGADHHDPHPRPTDSSV